MARKLITADDVESVIKDLVTHYVDATEGLASDLQEAEADRESHAVRAIRTYPLLKIQVDSLPANIDRDASFGIIEEAGKYESAVLPTERFQPYLREQLTLLAERYQPTVDVCPSDTPIPVQYLPLQSATDHELGKSPAASPKLSGFPGIDILKVDDTIADSGESPTHHERPLFLFDVLRVELALKRLHHYSGCIPEQFQDFVLFTNYAFHVDAFLEFASDLSENNGCDRLTGARYTAISGPGGIRIDLLKGPISHTELSQLRDSSSQMPAWHLESQHGGITLINIGVGPSNAKTITDCLAVLRPHCWIMLGHCAGLDRRMSIGDLVLPNSYLRRDHVLDQYVPLDTPVPALAEVQTALEFGIGLAKGVATDCTTSKPARTGTVMTTADRNWEWQPAAKIRQLLSSSAVIAVEMESATIAANGYRYRVPYGALLSVSDKPLHNEPKLPNAAKRFYEDSKRHHVHSAIYACQKLAENTKAAHSRKLRRPMGEVPFR